MAFTGYDAAERNLLPFFINFLLRKLKADAERPMDRTTAGWARLKRPLPSCIKRLPVSDLTDGEAPPFLFRLFSLLLRFALTGGGASPIGWVKETNFYGQGGHPMKRYGWIGLDLAALLVVLAPARLPVPASTSFGI